MSNMLEQAIIDAEMLREAALKNAEAAVVEKYAAEVKTAMSSILEEDVTIEKGMESVPSTFDPSVEEDDIVVVDLDQIIAAAEAEDGEEDEVSLDIEDVASEVGIPLDLDAEPATDPASRTDEEINLSEDDLLDMFKEMLVVDIDPKRIAAVEEAAEEDKKEEDEEQVVSSSLDAGMTKKEIEDKQKLERQVENLQKQNDNYKKIIIQAKDRLEEVNISNARLLYANRVLLDSSLNEQQKNKIVEMVTAARSVDEAGMIYETLQKTLASSPQKNAPQSLSEAVSRKSSVILGGGRHEASEDTDDNPVKNRWATLAGLKN